MMQILSSEAVIRVYMNMCVRVIVASESHIIISKNPRLFIARVI